MGPGLIHNQVFISRVAMVCFIFSIMFIIKSNFFINLRFIDVHRKEVKIIDIFSA